jgi:hypothetical protein
MTHNIQKAATINDVAIHVPRIYADVEDRQAEHQALVVEMEVKLINKLFPF